jgi:hypothetical protein
MIRFFSIKVFLEKIMQKNKKEILNSKFKRTT